MTPDSGQPRHEKTLYGSVSFLLSLADYPLIVLLPVYIGTTLGFGLATTGFLFALCRVLDVATDLAVGALTDRLNCKRDASLRLTILAIPVFVMSLCNLFWIGPETSWAWLVTSLLALYVARTLLDIPHASMGARLQIRRRDSFAYFGARAMFMIIGMLSVAVGVVIYSGDIGRSLTSVGYVGIVAGVLILGAFLMRWRSLDSGRVALDSGLNRQRLRHIPKPIWKVLFVFLLSQTGTAFAASLMVLYIEYVLHLKASSGIFLGTLFASGALSVPLWVMATKRFDHRTLWAGSMVFWALLFLMVPLIGAGQFLPYLMLCVLAGICFGADAVIPAGIIAVELRDGDAENVTATAFGLKALLSKAALVVPVAVAFPILEAFGFTTGITEIEPVTVTAITVLYALAPLLFKCPAAWLIIRGSLSSAYSNGFRRHKNRTVE